MKIKNVVLMVSIFTFLMIPSAYGVDTNIGITATATTGTLTESWLCDSRVVRDDYVEFWRNSTGGEELLERGQNYIFEGESIMWEVLVKDKNKPEAIDVGVYLGSDSDGGDGLIEVNCNLVGDCTDLTNFSRCNARIDEEVILCDSADETLSAWNCEFVAETVSSMDGEFWVTIQAENLVTGATSVIDEAEFWYFNPIIALTVSGDLDFGEVRPGTASYSDSITIMNDAASGSGVMLDMFISGTDFYDPASSGASCPTTNRLSLNGLGLDGVQNTADDTGIRYYAVNGAYSTAADLNTDTGNYDGFVVRNTDPEGYNNIQYGDVFSRAMYDEAEIIQAGLTAPVGFPTNTYYYGNILSPGSEMSLTFRLMLPEPCWGDFSSGDIYFWGEAI
jgi:hypothetical protein